MTPRLGILGGTFDPPHLGHLLAAYSAIELLELDRLVLIPAWRQPLKSKVDSSAPVHRLAMTTLLAAGDEKLSVDAIEIERVGLSFTVDTMRAYRAAMPDAALFLLMGEDTASTLPHWREPEALSLLVRIAVLAREMEASGGAVARHPGFTVLPLPSRRVDISASEIRERVRAGLPIRGFVTDPVAAYIAEHQLYRTTNE